MIKYVLKRIALLIPIMLGVSAIIFTLKTFTPGDPVRQILGNSASEEQMEAKREELGLDKPVVVQYAITQRNYPSVLGGVLILALILTLINLLVDISFILIDPRLKTTIISGGAKKAKKA